MRSLRFVSIFLLLTLLTACTPFQLPPVMTGTDRSWQYADLRLLDSAGDPKPEQDIVAAYARLSGADIEIRVDLLKSRSNADFDLYLAVDSQPGGKKNLPIQGTGDLDWEMWIAFPSGVPSSAVRSNGEKLSALTPRLYRDLDLDAAVIRLNQKDLGLPPERLQFQVFLTDPARTNVVDRTRVFSMDGLPPGRVPLLLAFWNTLPAQTPAQTLRRWNGAHTGPEGHRHGLAQIIGAVAATRVPAVLLDLKTPDSLAGLEQVSGLKQVQELAAQGLLMLPDAAFGDPLAAEQALEMSRKTGLQFGLPASPLVYAPLSAPPGSNYRVMFINNNAMVGPLQVEGVRVIQLPASGDSQPDTDGFNMSMRKSLLDAALQPAPPLMVLGGDVQQSMWADAEVAGKALRYIANHPWIEALGANDLLTLPAEKRAQLPIMEGCKNVLCAAQAGSAAEENLRETMRKAIQEVPDAAWRELTWMMYLRLTVPTPDIQRAKLQAGYLGEVGYLLSAGEWLRQPEDVSDCGRDVDWDGQPECILASRQIYTILEMDGARLAFAAALDNGQPQEWVAPSAQFAVGLSAPDMWQPERGQAGDPQVIPGGMADLPVSFAPYQPSPGPGQVTFSGANNVQKTYRLADKNVQVDYRSNQAVTTRIPLILGTGKPRLPGWGYSFYNQTSEDLRTYQWWRERQNGVQIQTDGKLSVSSPLDSFALMRSPEDPDREYPPGHFLPYPVVEVQVQANGPFTVIIGTK